MVDPCSEPCSCGYSPTGLPRVHHRAGPRPGPHLSTPDPLRIHEFHEPRCRGPEAGDNPCSCPTPTSRTVRSSCWRRTGLVVLVLAAIACTLPPAVLADRPPSSGNPGGGTDAMTSAITVFESSSMSTPAHRSRGHEHHPETPERLRHNLEPGVEFDEIQTDSSSTQRPATCPVCRMREELKRLSIESIKQQILHKLNLQQAPNMTGRRIPKYDHISALLDAHPGLVTGMQGDDPGPAFRAGPEVIEEEDDFHAKMERIIALPQTHLNKVRHRYRGHSILHFRFTPKAMLHQVAQATLWVWVRGNGHYPPPGRSRDDHGDDSDYGDSDEDEDADDAEEAIQPHKRVSVSVHRMKREGAHELEAKMDRPQPDGEGAWMKFNVKKMVDDWFRRPRDNLGLMVQTNEDTKHLVQVDPNDDVSKVPFLEVYLSEGRKRRTRRAMGLNCMESFNETRCCRYPLTVDFEAIGWDFIIAPKRYEANYCSGECPVAFAQKKPHTYIMSISIKSGPCCGPRKMSSMEMLFFDNDMNVVLAILPGMKVDRCGCL